MVGTVCVACDGKGVIAAEVFRVAFCQPCSGTGVIDVPVAVKKTRKVAKTEISREEFLYGRVALGVEDKIINVCEPVLVNNDKGHEKIEEITIEK